jgi:hypothetical protein
MDKNIVVPIALFAAVVYVIKLLVDARMRYLFWKAGSSPDALAALFAGEERVRSRAALRQGLVALALAGALGVVHTTGAALLSVPGIAALLGGLGVGNLAAFAAGRWFDSRTG